MTRNITLICLFVCLINIRLFAQYNVEAFTHPLSITTQTVSIYSSPDVYSQELKSDIEAGWIVIVKQRKGNYFQMDIEDLNLRNIWIHIGDVGIVIQNYDPIAIPAYNQPDTTSCINNYIYESSIALIYDISESLLFLQVVKESDSFFGWIERKYLCGNPYTTCN
jgi:hypothetical protein